MKKNKAFCTVIVLINFFLYPQATKELNHQLFEVVKTGNLDHMMTLVEKGADVNAEDENKATPVMWAAYKGHLDILKYLISKGADTNINNKDGDTALFFAISMGFKDIEEVLVRNGALISEKDRNIALSLLLIVEGGKALSNKQYEKAINCLEKVFKLNPSFIKIEFFRKDYMRVLAIARFEWAKDLDDRYDYEEAIDSYKKAYDSIGNDRKKAYEILFRIGCDYYFLDQYKKAIDCFKDLLKVGKELIDKQTILSTYNNIGLSYKGLRQLNKALTWFEKAYEFNKKIKENQKDEHYKVVEATVYTSLGGLYSNRYEYDKAIFFMEKAIKLMEDTGNDLGRILVLGGLGTTYIAQNKVKEGKNQFEQALTIAEKNNLPGGKGIILNNLGDALNKTGRFKDAKVCYEKALKIAKEVKDRSLQGTIHNNLGVLYQDISDFKKAEKHLKKALEIHIELKNSYQEALNLGNLGTVYLSLSRYDLALRHFKEALKIIRKSRDRASEATMLNNIGNLYISKNHFEKAQEYIQKSLKISEEIGDRHGKEYAIFHMGILYEKLGKYNEAADYFNTALEIAKKINDLEGEGIILRNLGSVYNSVGLYEEAITKTKKSLEIAAKIGDKVGQIMALNQIGHAYFNLKEDDKAFECYSKSSNITIDIGDQLREGINYYNLGLVKYSAEQFEEALKYFYKSLAIDKEFGGSDGEIFSLRRLSKTHEKMGQYKNALFYGKKSEAMAIKLDAQDEHAYSKINLANIYLKMGQKKKAVKKLEKALKIKNNIRFDFDFKREKMKLSFFENYLESYKTLFKLYMETGKYGKAFEIAESSKSVVFAEMMAKKKGSLQRANINRDSLYPIPVKIESLQKLLHDDETYISYYFLEEKAFAFVVTRDHFDFFPLDLDEKSIEDDITEMIKAINISFDAVKKLANKDMKRFSKMFAVYSMYPEKSNCLYQKLFKPLEASINEKKLLVSAEGILYGFPLEALVTKVPGIFEYDGKNYSLNNIMALKQFSREIPLFHEFSQMKYLGEKYSISYIPTASVLKVLRERLKSKRNEAEGLIAFADPVFVVNKNNENEKKVEELKVKSVIASALYVQRGVVKGWPPIPLPQTAEEAETFKNQIGKGKVYKGSEASEENVWEAGLEKARYILFSTHCILPKEVKGGDKIDLFEPALVLSLVNNPENYDGLLEMSEAARLQLNSDIVILSTCNSAGESGRGGEGFAGMARSFLFAGSQSVVASHWSVEVDATKMLMENYGKFLKEKGMGRLQALEVARNVVKNTVVEYGKENKIKVSYAHPYFWAAFVLLGER